MRLSYSKRIGLVVVLASLLSIIILYFLDINLIFEPKLLLPITNTLFASIIPLIVAYYAGRTYVKNGSLRVLWMGCGMLSFGLCAALAGWLRPAHHGANLNVTIYNTGALIGSLFHLFSSVMSSLKIPPQWEPGKEKLVVTSTYFGIFGFIILFTFATLQQIIPPFFIQGVGPTGLRQLVLGSAIFFYALSAVLFIDLYRKIRSDFLYWYSLCLAMLALGLFAFYLQKVVGSPIGWIGRTSNYLGAFFSLSAIWAAIRSGRSKGMALEDVISGFFLDAEAGYRSLVETANDAIVSVDQDDRIILWNSGAETIFGYTKGEAIGAPFFELLIPEDYSVVMNGFLDTVHSPQERHLSQKTIEIEIRRKEGDLLQVEISAFIRRLPNGWVNTCIMRDITERKRSQEALQTSEERYRNLFESMNEGFALHEIICDDKGRPYDYRFLQINPAFERQTGLKAADVVGHTLYEILPQSEDFWVQRYGSVALTGKPDHFDHWSEALGRHYQVSAFQVGKNCFGVVFLDITEQKRAEEALRKARDELEMRVKERTADLAKANEALRQLSSRLLSTQEEERKRVAGEIHDTLGSGLSAVKFKVEEALQQLGETAPDITGILKAAIPVVQESIEECRRIQQDLRPPMLDDLGLLATFSWFCRRFQSIYSHIRIEQEIGLKEEDIPNDLKIVIYRITQEAMNNLAKHSQAGEVHLFLQRRNGNLEFVIRDNGKGFNPEKVLSSGSTRNGLGLTSMRERAQLSGGSLTIESAEGRGTTVRASWPV